MNVFHELIEFLEHTATAPAALESLLPYTQASEGKTQIFIANDMAGVKALTKLAAQNTTTERNALSALINLSSNTLIREYLGHDILRYTARAVSSEEKYPGLIAMLLANLVHDSYALDQIGKPELERLALRFSSNLSADYDYLAFVFAELGRRKPQLVSEVLPGLFPQLLLSSLTRRGGVAAAAKNTLFDMATHEDLAKTDLIEHVMLALKGPEDMNAEDASEIPDLVRSKFAQTKKREEDPAQQLQLVEILILLSASQIGRDEIRKKHAYYIVRELHLAATDDQVKEACERFVNLIMRGDPIPDSAADDDEVTEVV